MHRILHAEESEHLAEHRYRDHAAADAEQPGQQSGHDAAGHYPAGEQEQFTEGHAKHAPTITGSVGTADVRRSGRAVLRLMASTREVAAPGLAARPRTTRTLVVAG